MTIADTEASKLSIFRHVLLLLLGVLCLSSALAQDEGNYAAEAMQANRLLDRAVAYYREKGEAAFAAFSRQGEFVDGEFYVYVVDTSGVMLASGGPSANLVGRNIGGVLDAELNKSFKAALALPEDGETHSADYHWVNWVDGKTERKRVFFRRVGERIFAVGYYMPRSSKQEAIQLLERASAAIAVNPAKVIEQVNSLDMEFIRDDLYVFIVDLDTLKFSAHGYNLRLVGTEFRALQSADQKRIGIQMLDALKKGGGYAEVSYLWRNPASNRLEQKSTLLRQVGRYAVAVGYYIRPGT
ncbi:cache domain-containing protein [Pseudomonas sp. R3.Fl]|jgi:cytochrome c|uniref:cache domain-containing protein n=1 Tax=Pseudomonas TaxID=286 RepID=UPI00078C2463|nr:MULTISPECIES: cache domain-containing protein [Pseudomonas]AMO77622.1 hypothetical protein PcP3B5_42210 [Pseudomonas citronellolis]MCL6692181.1 cache domain-containing protein [Pseudomonas sp. R3.Fl]MDN6875798.1 cache domain-containing protein [Pseudomonas citronellolis]WRT80801.1 cache domain-containing protein [Pseudomonas citronellolis]